MLGSLNLSEFVEKPFTPEANFEYNQFKDAIITGIKALNSVLDEGIPLHPLKEQQNMARDWRQVGLGVMGVGDMLIKLGIRYGSERAIRLCDVISLIMLNESFYASSMLAQASGTFSKYDADVICNSEFIKNNATSSMFGAIKRYGLRNSQLLTIAPTGSLSSLFGISGGMEPLFAKSYRRKTESLHGEDHYYTIHAPVVKQLMEAKSIVDESKLPDYVVTASEIPYQERIAMQSTWQKHVDAAISSTINVPEDFTKEQVFDLYIEAWKAGLKGVTIYRQGCEREGILTTDTSHNASKKDPESETKSSPEMTSTLQRGEIIEVSEQVVGKKRKLTTGCGSLHCAAFFDKDNGDLLEIYLSKGSQGGCANYMTGLSRMLSLSARSGCDVHSIVDQLNSTGTCPSYAVRKAKQGDTSKGSCCPMAVGNALLDMWSEMQEELGNSQHAECTMSDIEQAFKSVTEAFVKGSPSISKLNQQLASNLEESLIPGARNDSSTDSRCFQQLTSNSTTDCPECGEHLRHESGCVQCMNCGYSKCN